MKRILRGSALLVLCAALCVSLAYSAERRHAPSRRAALEAFEKIAFSSEYGGASGRIHKWTAQMLVSVHGNATAEDRAALQRAMDGLNAVPGFPGIRFAEDGANVEIWFVPLAEMGGHFTGYVPGNWGFFSIKPGEGGILRATLAIASDVTVQDERNHLIFEELLQSAGLLQDNYDRPDSIFYGLWTTVQQPSALDWELLGILYMEGVRHGMPKEEAMGYLEEHYGMD
jgi:hypothetical protein